MGRLSNIQHNNVSVKLTLLSSARAQERRPELRRIVGITVTVRNYGDSALNWSGVPVQTSGRMVRLIYLATPDRAEACHRAPIRATRWAELLCALRAIC